MSASNGIYVLETKGPEYRVAYAHNIDAIYGRFDDETGHWKGDKSMIKSTFIQSQLFIDEISAIDYATNLSRDHLYLEDGICVIRDFHNLEFNSL